MRSGSSVRVAAVAAISVVASMLTACSGNPGNTPGEKVVNIGVSSIVQKWDPHAQDWGAFLQPLQAAYDTLIRKNPDGSFGPALAAKWAYTTPTTFQITMRKDLVFSDDTKLDAAAVKANLDNAQKQVGPSTSLLKGWTTKVVDSLTVEITTPTPQPALPYLLSASQGMMVSPKALADYSSLNSAPVGDGPYVMDTSATVPNDHYTFVKNSKYWDAENVGFDKVVFKLYTDSTAEFHALQSGQIDAMAGDSTTVDSAKASGLTTQTYLNFFMGLSLQGQTLATYPFLKDQKVRQALEYATDREELQLAIGAGQPTTQIFPPGTEGYDKSLDNAYPHDPAKAKQLLAEAGYPNGISFTARSINTTYRPRYMQALQSQFAKAGIKMKIDVVPVSLFVSDRFGKDNPVYAWYYNPSNAYYDSTQILMPNGGFNPFHITDPKVISLYTEAAAATDANKRAKLYQEMSARFVDQAFHLITNFGDAYYYYNPKVIADWKPTQLEALPFIFNLKPAK